MKADFKIDQIIFNGLLHLTLTNGFTLHLQEDFQVVVFAIQEESNSSSSVQGIGQEGITRRCLG